MSMNCFSSKFPMKSPSSLFKQIPLSDYFHWRTIIFSKTGSGWNPGRLSAVGLLYHGTSGVTCYYLILSFRL
jgi:hypothetical protein